MIKKIFALLLVMSMVFAMTSFAADDITVLIDNEQIEFDVPPQIINERTMVPMRKIFETLGATVEWYGETQHIVATKDELNILMEIGKPTFSVTNVITGETKEIELDSPPIIINERTLVPARAISESIGYTVDWINDTRTVLIKSRLADAGVGIFENNGTLEWN